MHGEAEKRPQGIRARCPLIFLLKMHFQKRRDPIMLKICLLNAEIVFLAKGKDAFNIAKESQEVGVLTAPQSLRFYAEAGGQVGDSGYIRKKDAEAKIMNTFKIDNRIIYDCIINKGTFK